MRVFMDKGYNKPLVICIDVSRVKNIQLLEGYKGINCKHTDNMQAVIRKERFVAFDFTSELDNVKKQIAEWYNNGQN